MKIFLNKAAVTVLSFGMLVGSFASLVTPMTVSAMNTPPPASVVIDLINGTVPTGFCIAGSLLITGHGTRGTNGGPYSLDIGNGNGATTTVSVGSGANGAFTFTATFTPITVGSGLYINLYHGSASGNDSHITVFNQCLAPPTQGVVVVKKHVVGGSTLASGFTLHINGNNFAGSETGTTPGFSLNPGSYPITEDAVSGYTQTGFSCTDNNVATSTTGSTINVSAGHNYMCTVTNTFVPPTFGGLIVKKVLNNNGGGTAATSSFGFKINGGVTTAFNTNGENDLTLPTGVYVVTEPAAAHYNSVVDSGCTGTVALNATTTCTVTNTYFNNAPVAQDGLLVTLEDTPASTILLASDVDADTLTDALVTIASHGVAILTGSVLSYTPAPNYNGPDTVTFEANDGVANSNVATINIAVLPVNDAPVASNDSYSTNQDQVLNVAAAGVLANDTDVDGNTLTSVLVSNPSNGAVTLNADGSFAYTPNAGYVGSDSFTYKANDGTANSNVATVAITVSNVNDAPVAVADTYSTAEDTALVVPATGVLGNDTDADVGDTMTAALDTTTAHGTLSLSADGSFTYTPDANYNGTDSFTYHAVDAALAVSNTVTVTITVTPVNDAPVAVGQSVSTLMNVATSSILGATDADNNALTFATTSNPTNGTLSFFDAATGIFTYVPNLNFNGVDSFGFKANDGTVDSNGATVTINVAQTFENTLTLCTDGLDNDNDSLIDLADPDCAAFIPQITVNFVLVNDNSGTAVTTDFALTLDGTTTVSGFASTTTVGAHTALATGPSGYTITYSGDCDSVGVATLAAGDNKVCTVTANDDAPAPAPVTPPSSGGGGGGGGVINGPLSYGFGGNSGGVVLGTSTESTTPDCSKYLSAYIRQDKQNDSTEVTKLQNFLNNLEGNTLTVNGVYDDSTLLAVNNFQSKYANDVLTPWGITVPTGFVYYTTQKEINTIYCHFTKQFPLNSDQLNEIAHIKALGVTYNPGKVLGASTGPASAGKVVPTSNIAGTVNVPVTSTTTAPAKTSGGTSVWTKVYNWFFHN